MNYFTALSDINVPYMFINTNLIPPAELQAGAKLMSKDYFNCFSCHQQGDKKPEGPARGMGARSFARVSPLESRLDTEMDRESSVADAGN